jgi:PAS domain S-box-containing protein
METNLKSIFSKVPTSIMVFDGKGNILDANSRCLGYHEVESIDQLKVSLKDSHVWDIITAAVVAAYSGIPSSFQYCFENKHSTRWSKAVATPVLDEENSLIGVSVVEKDVTLKQTLLSELKQMKKA